MRARSAAMNMWRGTWRRRPFYQAGEIGRASMSPAISEAGFGESFVTSGASIAGRIHGCLRRMKTRSRVWRRRFKSSRSPASLISCRTVSISCPKLSVSPFWLIIIRSSPPPKRRNTSRQATPPPVNDYSVPARRSKTASLNHRKTRTTQTDERRQINERGSQGARPE